MIIDNYPSLITIMTFFWTGEWGKVINNHKDK